MSMKNQKRKICFLLGAGVSKPAGFPLASEITKSLLFPGKEAECTEDVIEFIQWLDVFAKKRLWANEYRNVNYEDLAYLVAQLRDDFQTGFENPALYSFFREIVKNFPILRSRDDFHEMINKTMSFMQRVVLDSLKVAPPSSLEHLNVFHEAISDKECCGINMFSLNHDTLMEEFLVSKNVRVIDGFSKENTLGIRCYNPSVYESKEFDETSQVAKLYKLHGAVNWEWLRPRKGCVSDNWEEDYLGIRSNKSRRLAKDGQNRSHAQTGGPVLLIGSSNKAIDYANNVFIELHYRFHRILQKSNRLVVCGYSFGDNGINRRIGDWLRFMPNNCSRKLLLIEPKTEWKMRCAASQAIACRIDAWKRRGYFEHLVAGIENITWEELKTKL